MRHLQRTKDHMVTFRRSDKLEVIGYLDFINYVHGRKSTFDYLFLLGERVIS